MSVVSRFKRKLKELEDSINVTIKSSIDANKPVLIAMNTKDQLYGSGEDATGKELVPSYAQSTKLIKRKKGQKTSNVTLKDSGDFYNSVNIQTSTTQAIFSTNVEYYKYLVAHYKTDSILGLQTDNKELFIDKYILPNLKKNFKAIITK